MGATGVKLQGEARRVKAAKAYELHILRVSNTEIGNRLEISRQLVATLIKEEAGRQSEERRSLERPKAIATYEKTIEVAWQRLAKIKDNSLNVSGLINAIISAQKAIDDITGIKADTVGDDMARKAQAYLDILDAAHSDAARDLSE